MFMRASDSIPWSKITKSHTFNLILTKSPMHGFQGTNEPHTASCYPEITSEKAFSQHPAIPPDSHPIVLQPTSVPSTYAQQGFGNQLEGDSWEGSILNRLSRLTGV
jgi:hypothetical protein